MPLAAVFSEQGERFVFVKKSEADEEFEKRPIRIGIADYDYAEVLSGLKPGEVVALEDKGFRSTQGTFGSATAGLPGGRSGGVDGGGSAKLKPGGGSAALPKPGSQDLGTGARSGSGGGSGSGFRPGGTTMGGTRPTITTGFGR